MSPQVPEFRVSMSIETDKFDALYKRLKPHGVTMTALLAKAVGAALAKHPVMFAGRRECNCGTNVWQTRAAVTSAEADASICCPVG
jgi:pyruvate dehydrogenase E2 component (dihydrolipoamide acetyltransferase)